MAPGKGQGVVSPSLRKKGELLPSSFEAMRETEKAVRQAQSSIQEAGLRRRKGVGARFFGERSARKADGC